MILEAKAGGKEFELAPEGVHQGVCVDVVDLGMKETAFGPKPKVRLVFEIDKDMADGRPFVVASSFTASIHPKAQLAAFLGKWRGKPIAEGEKIDLEKLIGASATLVCGHTEKDGKKFCNIDAATKPTKKLTPSGGYTRVKDRDGNKGGARKVESDDSAMF